MVAKFSLIDLAGSERITDSEKNQDRIDESKFINKSLSALGNVVAALRTQSKMEQKQAGSAHGSKDNTPNLRRSMKFDKRNSLGPAFSGSAQRGISANMSNGGRRQSVYDAKQPEVHKPHIPYRDSKLTHILKDSLGNNTFTHLIITLSPSYICLGETVSTLLFTKNAKAVKQNIVENVAFKQELQ